MNSADISTSQKKTFMVGSNGLFLSYVSDVLVSILFLILKFFVPWLGSKGYFFIFTFCGIISRVPSVWFCYLLFHDET